MILLPLLLNSSNAAEQLSVTISTDKHSYTPGEFIRVTGSVLDENLKGVYVASVSIQVNDPTGKVVHINSILTTQEGYFEDDFTAAGSVGVYTLFATANKPGFTDVINQITYAIQSSSSSQTPTETPNPSNHTGCIIATAAYGSELAPEVTYMRHVRDDMIASNEVGRMLVDRWNTFYYSWSPTVARWIANSMALQTSFRALLLPLIAIVHSTAFIYAVVASVSLTMASITAFFFAAVLSIVLYLWMPAFILVIICKKRSKFFLKSRSSSHRSVDIVIQSLSKARVSAEFLISEITLSHQEKSFVARSRLDSEEGEFDG